VSNRAYHDGFFPPGTLFIGVMEIALPPAIICPRKIASMSVPAKCRTPPTWLKSVSVPACDEGWLSNGFLNEFRIAGLTAMNTSSLPHAQTAPHWVRMTSCLDINLKREGGAGKETKQWLVLARRNLSNTPGRQRFPETVPLLGGTSRLGRG